MHIVKGLNSSISNNSIYHNSFVCTQLKYHSSIWLLSATFPGQSGHGSDGNDGAFCIIQSFIITWILTISFFSYHIQHTRWWSYPSVEMPSVYSTPPADWATWHSFGGGLTPLQRCSVFYNPSRLDWYVCVCVCVCVCITFVCLCMVYI